MLETILETVKSIDDKVDEILEQLGDYLDEVHYRRAWNGEYQHNGEEH